MARATSKHYTNESMGRRIVPAVVAILFTASAAVSQPASASRRDERPEFEVVSLKLLPHAALIRTKSDPGMLAMVGVGIEAMIRFAYSWEGRPEVAEKPFPTWIANQYWELTAKTPGPSTLDQQKLMMQKFLEERFGLVTHRESREGQIYAMTLTRNGNFEESKEMAEFGAGLSRAVPGSYDLVVSNHRESMQEFAQRLSGIAKQPVVDKTGLTGRYDISFVVPQNFVPALDGDESHATLALDKSGLFHNLEKMGLNLESQKGEYPVFIIDRINKPEELAHGRSTIE
jgi:uncharacterized protein (TIGR03435 family)